MLSILGWDDECEGLTVTIAREYEWRVCDAANEVGEWEVNLGGVSWDVTPPASPVVGVNVVGTGPWPVTVKQHAMLGGWPSEEGVLADRLAVNVSIEVHTNVDALTDEHTACRLHYIISYQLGF
jgi:hypothetical protein